LLEWLMSARKQTAGFALLGADALHNFGDGMAIAAAFLDSIRLGVITSLAVIVHEVPEEVADYAVLRRFGFAKRTALMRLGAVELTAGLGAGATLVGSSLTGANDIVLAIAAGTFIYIALVDLLPDVLRERSRRARLAALTGLVLGVVVVAVVP